MPEERYFLRQTEDGEWVIKEEMLTTRAEEWAEKFVGDDPKKPKLKSSQLRKFYNEIKKLEKMVEAEGFEKILPLIRMLKAKAEYQMGRGRKVKREKGQEKVNYEYVTPEFVDFITKCVSSENLQKEEDFKAFVKHFEAVVGYYYGKAEKLD